jgi:uncharacterized RDD family membrane protein YckC
MVKCEKCGADLKEDAAFCQQCGTPIISTPVNPVNIINLAGWGDRIIAYIIDMIIFGVIAGVLEGIIGISSYPWLGGMPMTRYVPFMSSGVRDVLLFFYFLFMDLEYGQSLGKMVMKLKVTNLTGGPIDITQAAIESFGKSFLLPIDVIIGWLFLQEKTQRLFSYLAKTIVVKKTE